MVYTCAQSQTTHLAYSTNEEDANRGGVTCLVLPLEFLSFFHCTLQVLKLW